MGLETGTTIEQLDEAWPTNTDPVSQGDDHVRLVKKVLKKQFPGKDGQGFSKSIVATEDELNYLAGATSNVQSQINNLSSGGSSVTAQVTQNTTDIGSNSSSISSNSSRISALENTPAPTSPAAAKAYIKFNGTDLQIQTSFGVNTGTLTRLGTGQFAVEISAATGGGERPISVTSNHLSGGSYAGTNMYMYTYATTGAPENATSISGVVF